MLECPKKFFHRHDVNATIHKARSESVTQRMPRHSLDFRLAASECESGFQINKRFAGLGIVENNFILSCQAHQASRTLRVSELIGTSRSFSVFGAEDSQNSFFQIHVQTSAKRKSLRSATPYSKQNESNPANTETHFGEGSFPLPDSDTRSPVLNSRKNFTFRTGFEFKKRSHVIARLNIRLSKANSRFTVEPETFALGDL